jgi:hypothetical protein
LGYCLDPDDQRAILSEPPGDPEAFIDAVLVAEGRPLIAVSRDERRPMLDIVTKWAVYDEADGNSRSGRPRFP